MPAKQFACVQVRVLSIFVAAVASGTHDLEDIDERALIVGNGASLMPGTIVGQGKYVLAEKIGDSGQGFCQAPNEMLLAPSNQEAHISSALVPRDGLTQAIAQDLPNLPKLPSPMPSFLPAVFRYSGLHMQRGAMLARDALRGYQCSQRLGRGSFGEVWRAVALDGSMREVVLKRFFVEQGEHVRQSGLREIFFGKMLSHHGHVSRFIEFFEWRSADDDANIGNTPSELWLVFHNEGYSLPHHLFSLTPGSMLVTLSSVWQKIKAQPLLGEKVIKHIIYQLLYAISTAHENNITHRDIKLSNVFVTDTWPPHVRLGDWGSALVTPPPQEFIHMYTPSGPTGNEETEGYQPPEVMFGEELLSRIDISTASVWRDTSYDMWSLGVLLLNVVLGSHRVFEVENRRWLKMEHRLRHRGIQPSRLPQARQVQALFDLCVAPRGLRQEGALDWLLDAEPAHASQLPTAAWCSSSSLRGVHDSGASARCLSSKQSASSEFCSDQEFSDILKSRDVMGIGLPSKAGRDLLLRLLDWSPETRISAKEALSHMWFDDGGELAFQRTSVPIKHDSNGGVKTRNFKPLPMPDSSSQGNLAYPLDPQLPSNLGAPTGQSVGMINSGTNSAIVKCYKHHIPGTSASAELTTEFHGSESSLAVFNYSGTQNQSYNLF